MKFPTEIKTLLAVILIEFGSIHASILGFDGTKDGFIMSCALGLHHTYFSSTGKVDLTNISSKNMKNGLAWDAEIGYSFKMASLYANYNRVQLSGTSIRGVGDQNQRYTSEKYTFEFVGVGSDLYLDKLIQSGMPTIYLKGSTGIIKVNEEYISTLNMGISLGLGVEVFPHISIEGFHLFVPKSSSDREVQLNSSQILVRGSIF